MASNAVRNSQRFILLCLGLISLVALRAGMWWVGVGGLVVMVFLWRVNDRAAEAAEERELEQDEKRAR